ncbi:MAG: hypothetical protein IID16_10535 [Candidatus Marinimicrobia bacterium]|nr:hypothetical protein [Candidatus Neomarinimicrobiota bacterium]
MIHNPTYKKGFIVKDELSFATHRNCAQHPVGNNGILSVCRQTGNNGIMGFGLLPACLNDSADREYWVDCPKDPVGICNIPHRVLCIRRIPWTTFHHSFLVSEL